MRRHCVVLVEALGVAPSDAAATAEVFVQAELMGEESHGLRLFLQILGRIAAGGDRAATDITVIRDRGAIALWDANDGIGQVAAARAMARAIEKAREHGLGLVTVRNGNSLTTAKHYALQAARAGMVGFVYTTASRRVMPPPGGRTPVLGNNPVAVAAPAGRHGCFALDMACTAAAVERIHRARDLGVPIPQGWALDLEGRETTDPAEALKSMSLLPFGGYKAFGIAMVNDIVTSILGGGVVSGSGTGFQPYDTPMRVCFTLQAIDVTAFQPLDEFERRMEAFLDRVKATEPIAPGDRIVFPGERALGEMARRSAAGVPVVAATIDGMRTWAERLGVPALQA
nr:Ldh family oxidoreductase [Rhodoplanes tepidamans]